MIQFLLAAILAHPALALEPPRTDYQIVAASQSNAALGPNGKKGDILQEIIIVPDTTSPGTVIVSDGSGLSQKVFVTTTLSDLRPIPLEIGMRSVSGGWTVTTGANEHVLAVGRFD